MGNQPQEGKKIYQAREEGPLLVAQLPPGLVQAAVGQRRNDAARYGRYHQGRQEQYQEGPEGPI